MKHFALIILFSSSLWADEPDAHRVMYTSEIWGQILSNSNIVLTDDDSTLQLAEGVTSGGFILKPDTMSHPFNRGLPSWNGKVFTWGGGFKVLMRFKQGASWSPWLTVGYWKDYIWASYGDTDFAGGYIDYDYAVLNDYHTVYQWSVQIRRDSANDPSPSIQKLSFFTSDSRTTGNLDYTSILEDDPPEQFIPTNFVCQYNVDPEIGGSICSPTSTVLAIRSYGISVDAYQFALDNKDTYWGIFGIWPRAVQNAARFGLDGAVTRYRSWSQAADTLAAGGRVVMSVGQPLYSGHLMMLAGFDANGNPIVHDPAKQNGYAYTFNKSDLSQAWFDKGGVGYTFFHDDTLLLSTEEDRPVVARSITLDPVFPNPFNTSAVIRYTLEREMQVRLEVFDLGGHRVATLYEAYSGPGSHQIRWGAAGFAAGTYLVRLQGDGRSQVVRVTLIK